MKFKKLTLLWGLTMVLTAVTACGSKAEDTAARIYGEVEEISEEDGISLRRR